MRCDQIKVLLSLYQDNEIGGENQSKIKSHLTECKSCREEFEQLEIVQNEIRGLVEIEPEQNFVPTVMERIKKGEKHRLLSVPSMVYSFIFVIFFLLGFLVSTDFKIEKKKIQQDVYIS